MPNYIANRVTLDGDITDQYLTQVKTDFNLTSTSFDFNKVIPQPPELVVDAIDTKVILIAEIAMGRIDYRKLELRGESAAAFNRGDLRGMTEAIHLESARHVLTEQSMANSLDDQRFEHFIASCRSIRATGHAYWLDWNEANWGTKSNAYRFLRPSRDVMTFETANAPPHNVLAAIASKHDCLILHEWADEDTGYNAGRAKYVPGSEPELTILGNRTKESYELAFSLWNGVADQYRYNETTGTYDRIEETEDGEE